LTSALDGSVQLHAPAVLPPRKEPLVPTRWIGGWGLGGPQSRSGRGGEEKNTVHSSLQVLHIDGYGKYGVA